MSARRGDLPFRPKTPPSDRRALGLPETRGEYEGLSVAEVTFVMILVIIGAVEIGALAWIVFQMMRGAPLV